MFDLEDDLRAARREYEADLRGPVLPDRLGGRGRNVYIIKFRVKGVDYSSKRAQKSVETMKVRANTQPTKAKARQMVTAHYEWSHLYPEEIEIESVRFP